MSGGFVYTRNKYNSIFCYNRHMKKLIIFLLIIVVSILAISYQKAYQAQLGEDLITAAYEGDLIGVKNLLEEKAPLNYVLYFDDPARHYENMDFDPLQAAASSGNEKLISYLINKRLNVNIENSHQWTPLFIAVRDGHAESAARLVRAGANINHLTDTKATALIMALLADFKVEKERETLIEYLLKRGANPNLQTQWKTDALYYAVTELKNPTIVQLLLKYKANVCRTYDGKTVPEIAPAPFRTLLQKTYQQDCLVDNKKPY